MMKQDADKSIDLDHFKVLVFSRQIGKSQAMTRLEPRRESQKPDKPLCGFHADIVFDEFTARIKELREKTKHPQPYYRAFEQHSKFHKKIY